ncbi:MAG: hypothetical protein LBR70_06820 [Lactobacillaceae bacterium]|jgi:hypothetical protein|nr:hypothetical protein [Lactobacillaceae bacterium]
MSNKKYNIAVTSSKNLGYTNSAKALAGVHEQFIEFDAMIDDETKQESHNKKLAEALKTKLSEDNSSKINLISAGKFGVDFYNDVILADDELKNFYLNNRIEFVWSSDRYYDVDLSGFSNGMAIIMPESEIAKYKEQIGKLPIDTIGVDLVAAADGASMDASAEQFAESNIKAAEVISGFDYKVAEFLGGRVQLPDGGWKENTLEVFAQEAKELLERAAGGNIVVGTHGLRTFTNGDKSNDFGAYNAFVETLVDGLAEGQKVMLITKDLREDSRVSVLQTLSKADGEIVSDKYDLEDKGSSYNFLLRDAANKNAKARVTGEQMNFPTEFLSVGGDSRNIEPAMWDLTVPSNVEAYEKIDKKTKAGEKLITAQDAYSEYVSSEAAREEAKNMVYMKALDEKKRRSK